jgi:hypothetical protein
MSRSHYPLDSPNQICPQISQQVSEAVMSGMALKASDRPATIVEWLDLLPQYRRRSISTITSIPNTTSKIVPLTPVELPIDTIESVITTISPKTRLFDKHKKRATILAGIILTCLGTLASAWFPMPIARQVATKLPESTTAMLSSISPQQKSPKPSMAKKQTSPLKKSMKTTKSEPIAKRFEQYHQLNSS